MNKDVFKRLIVEWFERDIPSSLPREVELVLNKEEVHAIIGPRRVGKTFLMLHVLSGLLEKTSKEEILFIDFEDNRLVGLTPADLDELFVAHRELTDKELRYLFFDEVQEIPNWSKFVRRLHNQGKYCIVVSGSSSKLLGKEIATELRGRYTSILLLPFSFREFLHLKGFAFDKQVQFSERKGELLRHLNEYVSYGGFPRVAMTAGVEAKKALVKSYFETIFYKDIVERHKIESIDVIEMMMNYVLNNNAGLFSISSFEKILKEKGIKASKKTISLYLKHLEDSFFIFSTQKFSYSAKTRLMNPKKVYLADNAFQTFLSSSFSPDKGKVLEATVMQEMKRKNLEAFYFKNKNECDFIIKKGTKITNAIQVCYELNEKNKKRETKGLIEALKKFNLKKGTILTFNQEKELKTENKKITVTPIWKWLLE